MTTVKLSKKKPHSTLNNSELIQGVIFIKQVEPARATSKKATIDKKQVIPIELVVIRAEPQEPKKRPKKPPIKDPRKGKKIIFKYMRENKRIFLRTKINILKSFYQEESDLNPQPLVLETTILPN